MYARQNRQRSTLACGKKQKRQKEEESSTDGYRNDIMGKCSKKTENNTKLKRGN